MLYERNTGGIYELLFKGESICVLRDTEGARAEAICSATMFDTTFKPVPETRKVWVNLYWDSENWETQCGTEWSTLEMAEGQIKGMPGNGLTFLKTVELEVPA